MSSLFDKHRPRSRAPCGNGSGKCTQCQRYPCVCKCTSCLCVGCICCAKCRSHPCVCCKRCRRNPCACTHPANDHCEYDYTHGDDPRCYTCDAVPKEPCPVLKCVCLTEECFATFYRTLGDNSACDPCESDTRLCKGVVCLDLRCNKPNVEPESCPRLQIETKGSDAGLPAYFEYPQVRLEGKVVPVTSFSLRAPTGHNINQWALYYKERNTASCSWKLAYGPVSSNEDTMAPEPWHCISNGLKIQLDKPICGESWRLCILDPLTDPAHPAIRLCEFSLFHDRANHFRPRHRPPGHHSGCMCPHCIHVTEAPSSCGCHDAHHPHHQCGRYT
jgi:hypothetical protein